MFFIATAMKNNTFIQIIQSLACYLLIFLFTYTGVSKLLDHSSFEAAILQSPILRNYSKIISWLLPVSEFFIVVMLLWKRYRRTGFLLSLFTLTVFTIYIGYMVLFVPSLPCSCGGVLKQLSWSGHILFNCFFIILILGSLFTNTSNKIFIAINRKSRKPV